MKAYFSVIKTLQPQMSKEANSILTRYYQLQRQSDGRNTARTTVRMLESLSRLAEGDVKILTSGIIIIVHCSVFIYLSPSSLEPLKVEFWPVFINALIVKY